MSEEILSKKSGIFSGYIEMARCRILRQQTFGSDIRDEDVDGSPLSAQQLSVAVGIKRQPVICPAQRPKASFGGIEIFNSTRLSMIRRESHGMSYSNYCSKLAKTAMRFIAAGGKSGQSMSGFAQRELNANDRYRGVSRHCSLLILASANWMDGLQSSPSANGPVSVGLYGAQFLPIKILCNSL